MTISIVIIPWLITIISLVLAFNYKPSGDYDFTGPIWVLFALLVTAISWAVYFAFR